MVLTLATFFVGLVLAFGVFLVYANPVNIERPYMVGAFTTVTSLIAAWLIWLEWHTGTPGHTRGALLYSLLAVSGFALGRAVDKAMGPRLHSADERQSTLGADLAD